MGNRGSEWFFYRRVQKGTIDTTVVMAAATGADSIQVARSSDEAYASWVKPSDHTLHMSELDNVRFDSAKARFSLGFFFDERYDYLDHSVCQSDTPLRS